MPTATLTPPIDAHLSEERPPRSAEEVRLRRVTVADGRDPSAGAPLELTWHERRCSALAAGQFVIEVPYVGGPPPAGVDPVLTAALRERWTGAAAEGPWKITSVVAAFRRAAARSGVLQLAVGATPAGAGASRLDGVAMARDLQAALSAR